MTKGGRETVDREELRRRTHLVRQERKIIYKTWKMYCEVGVIFILCHIIGVLSAMSSVKIDIGRCVMKCKLCWRLLDVTASLSDKDSEIKENFCPFQDVIQYFILKVSVSVQYTLYWLVNNVSVNKLTTLLK